MFLKSGRVVRRRRYERNIDRKEAYSRKEGGESENAHDGDESILLGAILVDFDLQYGHGLVSNIHLIIQYEEKGAQKLVLR